MKNKTFMKENATAINSTVAKVFAVIIAAILSVTGCSTGENLNGEESPEITPDYAICSACGNTVEYEIPDGICEDCAEPEIPPHEHADTDEDAYCDVCNLAKCFFGAECMGLDFDKDCICDECGSTYHMRGAGSTCSFCETCNAYMTIEDKDHNGFCDFCGDAQCDGFHWHYDSNEDGLCDFCEYDFNLTAPESPSASVVVNSDNAVFTINPVEKAEGYYLIINGNYHNVFETTYTVDGREFKEGLNEVYVCAYNRVGQSENTYVGSVGKLAEPSPHIDELTIVEMIFGDVENAMGYKIYDEDKTTLIATIGLGGKFDFTTYYTSEAFYFPYLQAYADGWISSNFAGLPIDTRADGQGPIGYGD